MTSSCLQKMKKNWRLWYKQYEYTARNGIWHRKMCHTHNGNGKRQRTEGIELPNRERIRMLAEKENYKYLGIMEMDTIKRTRKFLEANFCDRTLIKGTNTEVVLLVRYLRPFLKLTKEELRQVDQRTRKLMMMHKSLYLRDDIDDM